MDYKKYAVLKNQLEAGTKISSEDLESVANIEELALAGVLNLNDDVLTREEALGAYLNQDVESLEPLNRSMVKMSNNKNESSKEKKVVSEENVEDNSLNLTKKGIHIEIESIKGLKIDLPLEILSLLKQEDNQDSKELKPEKIEEELIEKKGQEPQPRKNTKKWNSKIR